MQWSFCSRPPQIPTVLTPFFWRSLSREESKWAPLLHGFSFYNFLWTILPFVLYNFLRNNFSHYMVTLLGCSSHQAERSFDANLDLIHILMSHTSCIPDTQQIVIICWINRTTPPHCTGYGHRNIYVIFFFYLRLSLELAIQIDGTPTFVQSEELYGVKMIQCY